MVSGDESGLKQISAGVASSGAKAGGTAWRCCSAALAGMRRLCGVIGGVCEEDSGYFEKISMYLGHGCRSFLLCDAFRLPNRTTAPDGLVRGLPAAHPAQLYTFSNYRAAVLFHRAAGCRTATSTGARARRFCHFTVRCCGDCA